MCRSSSLAHFRAAGDGSRLYACRALTGSEERPSVTTRRRDKRTGLSHKREFVLKREFILKRKFITHFCWGGRESETCQPRHHESNQAADEDVPRPRDLSAHKEHVKHHHTAHDHADQSRRLTDATQKRTDQKHAEYWTIDQRRN